MQLNIDEIQKIDILTAGFPCQPFSVAGYRKGFNDNRGNHFFRILDFVDAMRPKVVFLENVKNLSTHDHGKTMIVIEQSLRERNYSFQSKVLNTKDYGNIPHNRERIFMIAFDKDFYPNAESLFEFPKEEKLTKTIKDLIIKEKVEDNFYYNEDKYMFDMLKETMKSEETVYQFRRQYVRENKSNVCPTLTANMGTGGHNVPLIKTEYGFRKLTPRECLRFQGFPDTFNIPTDIANSAVYKQAGNSVSVPVIQRGFRKTVANQLVTERELRASKASMVMGMRLMKTGQLTENSVIFDDFLGIPGFCVNLSLIYRDKAPIDFDVMDWYNTRPVFLQERISELMFDVTFSNKNAIEQFLASKSGHKMVRCISSDIVEGDSKKLIGYFFYIEYNRL